MPWPFVPPDPDAPAPLASNYTSSSSWRTAVHTWAGVPSHSPETTTISAKWTDAWNMEKGGTNVGLMAQAMRDAGGW